MKNLTLSSLFILASLCFSKLLAQEDTVSYSILENRPVVNKLELYLNPLEGRGANMGPSITSRFRVNSRLMTELNAFSAIYLNNYRSNFDGPNPDSFKNLGGIYLDASANFAWRKSKVKIEGESEKFVLDSKSQETYYTRTTTIKYLPFQYNTVIERFLKVGGYYDDYPLDYNTLSGVGLVLGLHSNTNKAATVRIGEQTVKNRREIKKGLNVFVGSPVYRVDSLTNGSPFGFSVFMGTTIAHSNSADKRILQSFDFSIELGVKPGGVGFLGFKLGFPIFRLGKQYLTPSGAEFKTIKYPTSKMRKLTLGAG